MNLSGHYFQYDGKSSSVYGLKILNLNTERMKKLSGDIEYKTSFNRVNKKTNIHGIDWSGSSMSQEIEFISEEPIDMATSKKIKAWLFNRPNFKRLYQDNHLPEYKERVYGDIKREYLDCVFYNPEEIRFADGLHGWKAQMMASTTMPVQEEISVGFGNPQGTIEIDVDTDIDDYVYPTISVVVVSGGASSNISIVNETDNNRVFQLNDFPSNGTTLIIDNATGTVSDDTGISHYDKVDGKRFFRLLPGKNVLNISGRIRIIQFTWSNARWFL